MRLEHRFVLCSNPVSSIARRRARCTAEPLERRVLFSTWVVNALSDTGAGAGRTGDLRYCVNQTNAAAGSDTIKFDSRLFDSGPATLSLSGGVLNIAGNLRIQGPGSGLLTVNANRSSGIFGILTSGTATLSGMTLTQGSGAVGGGIENAGNLVLNNMALTGNSSSSGGGIYNDVSAIATVKNSIITANNAEAGGGICNFGALYLSNSTVNLNYGDLFGGGIANSGTAVIATSNVLQNSANGDGGGISNRAAGNAIVSQSTIGGNSSSYAGGGISNFGSASLYQSTVANNSTRFFGGGVYNATRSGGSAASFLAVDSTFANNQTSEGTAGGIYSSGNATLVNATITSNSAAGDGIAAFAGGGIFAGAGTPSLFNTIVAGNLGGGANAPDDLAGAFAGRSNLVGCGDGATGLNNSADGNQVGTALNPIDPMLLPLADNGGPTQTCALRSNSPAIDAGNNALAVDPGPDGIVGTADDVPLSSDQRGRSRVVGVVDVGAYESRRSSALLALVRLAVARLA